MNPAYMEIIEQIRAQCQHNHWFGPPELKPNRAAWAPQYRPGTSNFVFPPATENQLRQTEAILGFPIPPLLRALYTHLANGGFGPGAGIRGAMGGYGTVGTFEALGDDTIVRYHASANQQFIDLAHYADKWVPSEEEGPYLDLYVPYNTWPRQLIPISDLGCVMEACTNAEGQFFIISASRYDDKYMITNFRISLEQWLRYWLQTGKTWVDAGIVFDS